MTTGRLIIGTKRYSSWSLRGWLAVHLAGLPVEEEVVPLAGGTTPGLAARTPSGTVPALFHDGQWIWESLAIAEYCAEIARESSGIALWPADRDARSFARAIAAEMHAGFGPLRRAMPMNLGRAARPLAGGMPEDVAADISRVAAIWREARARFGAGGPYLFGAQFGAADAMFAPVVTRLISYAAVPDPGSDPWTAAYVEAVRAHPLVARWYEEAASEPAAWLLPKMEELA